MWKECWNLYHHINELMVLVPEEKICAALAAILGTLHNDWDTGVIFLTLD